mgnify:CR=1 FL=1
MWFEGFMLPTEAELCTIYQVSRITIRRTLEELEKSGLVVKMAGRGTIVKSQRFHSGESQKGFLQIMAEQGYVVTSRLLRKELIVAPENISRLLGLETGQHIWHFQRLRLLGSQPIVLMDTYVSQEIGDKMLTYDLESMSFYKLYATILNKPISSTTASVTATNPSNDICDLLKEPHGSAEIWYKSIGYIDTLRPIEVNFAVFNAKYYEFSVDMNGKWLATSPISPAHGQKLPDTP